MLPADDPSVTAFADELYAIANELNSLTRRLNILLHPNDPDLDPFTEQPIESPAEQQQQPTPPPTDLFIGDRVVILSNYKKLRGATGTIGGFRGTTQVLIALDNSDQVIVRALRSVQLRSNRRSHY